MSEYLSSKNVAIIREAVAKIIQHYELGLKKSKTKLLYHHNDDMYL